jgi:predicted AlkP superfamily phosphohydrolase/phosphomutase
VERRRVLAIGLDGYEPSLEDRLVAAGELPAIADLRRRSARFQLDHGPAQRTGLAWEHVATGLAPAAADRFAAVTFDPETYSAWQEGTRRPPFATQLAARAVVFDAPYFDLAASASTCGVVNWGAHDPGVAPSARPAGLLHEVRERFGAYPATGWIYGFAWPSPERCEEMGRALVQATETRARAARWLLGERLPDWDLALVVASEPHSAIEGLWHGVDETHPLHQLPSARPAGEALRAVYRATDRLVADLVAAFPDAAAVVFSMGGMGPNRSDAASMFLLPELLHRHAFGRPLMEQPEEWSAAPGGVPLLGRDDDWSERVNARIPLPDCPPSQGLLRRALSRAVPEPWKDAVRRAIGHSDAEPPRSEIGWMPATRYRPHWPAMRAFALPSFYDGRVRINLAGRERQGNVAAADYAAACDEVEMLVRACRDPRTGEGVVDFVERPAEGRDPLRLGATESDLVFVWNGPIAFDHPTLGRVGPIPFRRTGGHTGRFGMAYLHDAGLDAGDHGVRSSFDVVPTLFDLLGVATPRGQSGASLLPATR